jgi:hypothetical protein
MKSLTQLFILVLLVATTASAAEKTITISGSTGVPGVTLKGLPVDPVTDSNGDYRVEVPLGFAGTVAPVKVGYAFEPPSRRYTNMRETRTNESYVASAVMFRIVGNTGMSGAIMKGLPGDPVTGPDGSYSAAVQYGWSGTVTPEKKGYHFEPVSKAYTSIQHDLRNEDYRASVITFTISGNVGMPGVRMVGLPRNCMTDATGAYSITVPYGWRGRVVPQRSGFVFDPPDRTYDMMTAEQTGQDYAPQRSGMTQTAMAPDVLVVPTLRVDPVAFSETADDMRVMLQILREKSNEQRPAMGRTVLPDYGPIFGSSGQGTKAIYIQGYGAMFVMEVGFPLARASQATTAGRQAQQQGGDPVWRQAQQRLEGGGEDDAAEGTNSFNPEQFRENMVRALRHAANIRHLDPNECIILTIIGSARSVSAGGVSPYGGSSFQSGGGIYGGSSFSSGSTGSYGRTDSGGYTSFSSQGSVGGRGGGGRTMGMGGMGPAPDAADSALTIQAKKIDIDAFAGDKISFEQFNQRVKVFNY